MKSLALRISMEDLLESLKKLSREDKKVVHLFLESELINDEVHESKDPYLVSEKSLRKDWLTEEENEAWKDL